MDVSDARTTQMIMSVAGCGSLWASDVFRRAQSPGHSQIFVRPAGEKAHMERQLRKPARERATYSEQFKREALELGRTSGRSAAKIAEELGIRAPLLYRWAYLERIEPKEAIRMVNSTRFCSLEIAIHNLFRGELTIGYP